MSRPCYDFNGTKVYAEKIKSVSLLEGSIKIYNSGEAIFLERKKVENINLAYFNSNAILMFRSEKDPNSDFEVLEYSDFAPVAIPVVLTNNPALLLPMGFELALKGLKKGRKIGRLSWPENIYLEYYAPENTRPFITINGQMWEPYQEDLLEEDWVVIPRS